MKNPPTNLVGDGYAKICVIGAERVSDVLVVIFAPAALEVARRAVARKLAVLQ